MEKPDIENNLGYLLNSTTNALNTLMQRVILAEGVLVPLEQVKLLIFISFHDGTTQQAICDKMQKAKTGISRLVDGLVKKKMVFRIENEYDRRNKNLFITEKGLAVRDKFHPLAFQNLQTLENDLGKSESAELKEHLLAIRSIILNKINK